MFTLSRSEAAWREQVRAFLTAELSAEVCREVVRTPGHAHGPAVASFRRKVADTGWLALTWPEEFGGLDASHVEQFLMFDEFEYAGAPLIDLTSTGLAPIIMRFGSRENCEHWLPRIRPARSSSPSVTPSRTSERTCRACGPGPVETETHG